VAGLIIVATSLRILFDPDFQYLLQQHGSFLIGYVLLALGALMALVSLYGMASILVERPCLLWVVRLSLFFYTIKLSNNQLSPFFTVFYSNSTICGW